MPHKSVFLLIIATFVVLMTMAPMYVDGVIARRLLKNLTAINEQGPFLGVVVPNTFELNPLLQSPSFEPNNFFPYQDFWGRRFRIGKLAGENVIIVMTGLGMLNAGLATQMLIALFDIKGVVHYGIAGNGDPNHHIGDVVIPRYWAHTGLWNWQRFGLGPEDELPLEANGDYTREIGYIKFANYNTKLGALVDNLLNNVWYQPEEIFLENGIPESREHIFFVPVDENYYAIAKQLEGMKLTRCVNSTTCLEREPRVSRVEKGGSASIFVDNAAYREFLNVKFNITAIEMESAAVALVCHQQLKPFIVLRALSDLAGGGSSESNEASVFVNLASENSVNVAIKFVSLLSSSSLFTA